MSIFRLSTIISHTFLLNLLLSNMTVQAARHFPPGANIVAITPYKGVEIDRLKDIAPLVLRSIADGAYPGAVILAGYQGHVIYQGVFGNRRLEPSIAPMQLETIFDVASLTKVVATAPAIMQLVEQKKLSLNKPVAFYWHDFAKNGKAGITIRQLLTHTSGLPGDLPPSVHVPVNAECMYSWRGEKQALREIINVKLVAVPGTKIIYSDINFVILAYLVEKITGQRIDKYAQTHIFTPLGMMHTRYLPQAGLLDRIAPTAFIHNKLRWGRVNDPTAYAMNGVAGDAGVFSTASDLAIYAQTMLNKGLIKHSKKKYLLRPNTVASMIMPQTPAVLTDMRGLGWDIGMILTKRRSKNLSYGHTGWTGTSLWINPKTQTWLIILTSRTHPRPLLQNKLIFDRYAIADLVARSIKDS